MYKVFLIYFLTAIFVRLKEKMLMKKNLLSKTTSTLNKLFIITFFIFFPVINSYSKCPDRIVSLTLASDEILVDIVRDKDRIRALTYLSSDNNISNVADKTEGIPRIYANLEQVFELSPDIVIVASYINSNFRKQLADTKINTLYLKELGTFDSIKENIRLIGKAVCEQKNAEELIKEMDKKLEKISKKISINKPKPLVLYYSPSGDTAGFNSTINEIIEKAGAQNLGSKAGINGYGKISLEYIIENDPDLIILSSFNPSNPDFAKEFISNTALKDISAVRKDRVKVLAAKNLISASHYVVNSVDDLVDLVLDTYWKNELQK
ncbi:MAG: ABC transporter substrate-binding protein [Thermodesulfobacteriota bacterium]